MKTTQTCPKCDGRRFVITPTLRVDGGQLPALYVIENGWLALNSPRGSFEAWMCRACGYTELYAQGLEAGIEQFAEKYPDQVRLVDAGPKPQAPYR